MDRYALVHCFLAAFVVRAVVIMSGFKELRLQGFENPLNIFIRFNCKRRMEVLGKDFNSG